MLIKIWLPDVSIDLQPIAADFQQISQLTNAVEKSRVSASRSMKSRVELVSGAFVAEDFWSRRRRNWWRISQTKFMR